MIDPKKMPTFLVIGAGKSGSTSLYHYLTQHPDIYMSRVKEPLFFAFAGQQVNFTGPGDAEINGRAVATLEDYQALFQDGADRRARGEASVAYLYYPRAAQRIHQLVPEVKLLLILRCPADRAYSNFLHALGLGREPIGSFTRALEAEPGRIAAGWSHFYHYRAKGWYYRQLEPWLRLFPREQILINLYDDLEEDPAGLLQKIFEFIGIDSHHPISTEDKFNVSGSPWGIRLRRSLERGSPVAKRLLPERIRAGLKHTVLRCTTGRSYMPSTVREKLMTDYAPDITQLAELIGRDLSGWFHGRSLHH